MESEIVKSNTSLRSDTAIVDSKVGGQAEELKYITEIRGGKIKVDGLLTHPIQLHERHDNLIPLKIMLNWIGYGVIDISAIFGSFTEKRVKEFQRDHDLPVSGIIDNSTIIKINKVFFSTINDPNIKLKSIKYLKQDLNRIGFGGIMISSKLGSFTVNRIKEFQDFYGLPVTGQVNVDTLGKISELRSSPLQVGKHHSDLILLKKYLNILGYGRIKITNKFGKHTERKIKKFQKDHGMPVSGIIDHMTRAKINEVFCSTINKPNSKHQSIKYIKEALNRIGYGGIEVSAKLGPFAINRIKEFQDFYGLSITGQVNVDTLNKIDEIVSSRLQVGKRHKDVVLLKKNLNLLGYGRIPYTNKFGEFTEKKVKHFQKDFNLPVSGIVDKFTFTKINQATRYREKMTYNYYDITLNEALNIQMNTNLQTSLFKQQDIHGEQSDVETYLNPENLIKDEKEKFQLLDLSRSRVVTPNVLHKYLKGNGILGDKEQAFIDAGKTCGINEILLVSHASLEVEKGSSSLAFGIPVDKHGRITYVEETKNNVKVKLPGKTSATERWVYNFYGISVKEGCELFSGAKKAFDEGWDTPEKAIIGGAKFIKEMYLRNGKNTLYHMRWNPTKMVESGNMVGRNTIDKDWFSEQIDRLHSIYRQLDSYVLYLEIPVYKK